MTAQTPGGEGGRMAEDEEEFPTKHPKALRLMEQNAIKQRWPVPDERRAGIINRQADIATDPEASNREATSAARCLISAERQNQIDDLAHDDSLARQPVSVPGVTMQNAQVIMMVPDNNRGPNRIERD